MIDPARLEIALIAVARRYAPTAAPPTWARPGDFQTGLPELARRLASEGALVLSAEAQASAVPTDASAYTAWVDTYKSLYTILCRTLFPSFMRIDAFYVDQLQPPIAIVYGECAPVMTALGGYVTPYAAMRSGTRPSEIEMRGMLDLLFEALEAGDLPRPDYAYLRDECLAVLRGLLDLPLYHTPIMPSLNAIFHAQPAPATPPTAPPSAPPPPPTTLPSAQKAPPPPPPQTLPTQTAPAQPTPPPMPQPPPPTSIPERRAAPDAVPLFFNPAKRNPDDLPPPPLPPLPR